MADGSKLSPINDNPNTKTVRISKESDVLIIYSKPGKLKYNQERHLESNFFLIFIQVFDEPFCGNLKMQLFNESIYLARDLFRQQLILLFNNLNAVAILNKIKQTFKGNTVPLLL